MNQQLLQTLDLHEVKKTPIDQPQFYSSQLLKFKNARQIVQKEGLSSKIDVLHFGWLLCYLVSTIEPTFDMPANATPHQRYLIQKCLNKKPEKRPTFKNIIYIIKSPADWAIVNQDWQSIIDSGHTLNKLHAETRQQQFDGIQARSNQEILDYLCKEVGCDIFVKDINGDNALHQAIRQKAIRFIPLLLCVAGELLLQPNSEEQTPSNLAKLANIQLPM